MARICAARVARGRNQIKEDVGLLFGGRQFEMTRRGGRGPARGHIQAQVAGDFAAVGSHRHFDSARLGVAEDQCGFGQAHRHRRDHRERTNLFAIHAIDIAILHRPCQLDFGAGYLHAEMRGKSGRVFGQSDVARIGNRIQRAVFRLCEPIRLGVRLVLGNGEARVIPAGLIVGKNGGSQVHRGSAFHTGKPDSGKRHLVRQALDRGEVDAKRRAGTHGRLVGLSFER